MPRLNSNFHNKKCTIDRPPNHALLSNSKQNFLLAKGCTLSPNQNV